MKNLEFNVLSANDVEARVGTQNSKGVSLLLYKDARVDMRMLDEVVGSCNWQREHYEVKGNMYCKVGIYAGVFDKNRTDWIWKSDCGTESNTEKEKGEASDAFKRACFNWGIGRELYTAPFIWVKTTETDMKNGKLATRFRVHSLTHNADGSIKDVVIVDDNGNVRYGKLPQAKTPAQKPAPAKTEAPAEDADVMTLVAQALADIEKADSRKAFEQAMKKHNAVLGEEVVMNACAEKAKIYPNPNKK